MKRFFFITLLFIFKLFPTRSFSQVIIGDTISYKPGILLNLNETIKGGLLLSNVHITDLKRIPTGTDIFPGIMTGVNDSINVSLRGAMVYNTNKLIGDGVYVWTGQGWTKSGEPV